MAISRPGRPQTPTPGGRPALNPHAEPTALRATPRLRHPRPQNTNAGFATKPGSSGVAASNITRRREHSASARYQGGAADTVTGPQNHSHAPAFGELGADFSEELRQPPRRTGSHRRARAADARRRRRLDIADRGDPVIDQSRAADPRKLGILLQRHDAARQHATGAPPRSRPRRRPPVRYPCGWTAAACSSRAATIGCIR